jgi:hypothetical protein
MAGEMQKVWRVYKVDTDRLAQKAKGGEMRKQLYRGLTMTVLLVAVTLAVAVGSANAQSSRKLTADVPFDFSIGDKTFAAGAYEVKAMTADRAAMVIRNEKTQQSITRLTNTIQTIGKSTQARLVFHKYGNSYFLAEVWSGGDYAGRQLLESKRERALRHEMRAVAQNRYERIELMASVGR